MSNRILVLGMLLSTPLIAGCTSRICSDSRPNASVRYVDVERDTLKFGIVERNSFCEGTSEHKLTVHRATVDLGTRAFATHKELANDFDTPSRGDASRHYEGDCLDCTVSVRFRRVSGAKLEASFDERGWEDGDHPMTIELRDESADVLLRVGYGYGEPSELPL